MAYYGPPPFQPPPVQRKSNAPLIITIILACVLVPCLLLGALGWWGYNTVWKKAAMPMAQCAIAFEEVKQAIVAYSKDHNGKLPEAAHWQDLVRPYYAKIARSQAERRGPFAAMNPNGSWGCAATDDTQQPTGMAYNSEIAGKKIDDIKDPESTVLIYEVPKATANANAPYSEPAGSRPVIFGQPRDWLYEYVKGRMKRHHSSDTMIDINDDSSSSSDSDNTSASGKPKNGVKVRTHKDESSTGGAVHININTDSGDDGGK